LNDQFESGVITKMNRIPIHLFIHQYPLLGRSILGIQHIGNSTNLLFDLFHCDDAARNREDSEYLLKLEVAKEAVTLETENTQFLEGEFFGSVLKASFDENKIEILSSCEQNLPIQGLKHQGAVLCTSPIHSAQAELANSARPAIRMAHWPEPCPRKRSHSQGPAISDTPLPSAKSAITPAPWAALLVIAATNSAEYSRPQGSKAHNTPIKPIGARVEPAWPPFMRVVTARTPRQTLRAESSSQMGWRACQSSIKPSRAAVT
jgi:hypothetical protein